MPLVYLSIGSNEGEPRRNVELAIKLIASKEGVSISGRGGLYETEPQGKRDQRWFVNTVVTVETDQAPEKLLESLREIESKMGREEKDKWDPRVIDIDILFYNNEIVNRDNLTIPHKLAHERRFVLGPMGDIDPDFIHPLIGKSVSDILADIPAKGQAMRRIDL